MKCVTAVRYELKKSHRQKLYKQRRRPSAWLLYSFSHVGETESEAIIYEPPDSRDADDQETTIITMKIKL